MFTKKIFIITTIALALSFFSVEAVLGQDPAKDTVLDGLNTSADTADITKGTGNLPSFIGGVINYSFSGIAAIFVTVIMIGGYLWMTARGNEEKVGKAKTFILNGFFGLMVVFIGYGLVYAILTSLGDAIGA